ncbi:MULTISPECIES: DUF6686 family protein [Flavobacteriaceae]|uniref:DUF6686 family protein n=1 Tax=Flavobacteriaceae TaxID=49546 RepID=UPI001490E9D8|nr:MULTISPECIES: DUF6686 family protein [Allomuricauda]MDC6367423.1 hypothetical protein [Muricauda sp. AC10]
MCNPLTIVNQSRNGVLTFCNRSKLFQLIFNNLCFELYEWELEAFTEHLKKLDIPYWEQKMSDWTNKRKIPISVGKDHFIILVNKEEIYEMLQLISFETLNFELLNHKDINYRFIEN